MLVTIADVQVAVQRQRRLVAKGKARSRRPLPSTRRTSRSRSTIGQLAADQLPTAGAGVKQEHDEDGVLTSLEALSFVHLQKSPQAIFTSPAPNVQMTSVCAGHQGWGRGEGI